MSSDPNPQCCRPTPFDADWEAEFDPNYDIRTQEDGDWFGLDVDEIEDRQMQEFLCAEEESDFYREEQQRIADEDEDNQ